MLPTGTADAIKQGGDYADVILRKSVPAYGEQENEDGQNTKAFILSGAAEGIYELQVWPDMTLRLVNVNVPSRMMKAKTSAIRQVLLLKRGKNKRKSTKTKPRF